MAKKKWHFSNFDEFFFKKKLGKMRKKLIKKQLKFQMKFIVKNQGCFGEEKINE